MYSLSEIGFKPYYKLDGDRIYNEVRKCYLKPISEYRYRLVTKDGFHKSITIKDIYKKLFGEVFCKDNIDRFEGEEFKEIEGTEGNYYISNFGRCLSYVSNNAIILKPTITSKGYERIQITIEGQRYNKYIHVLVAAAWLGKPQSLEQEIHHKDFNKRNNNYTNLQYLYKNEHIKKHAKRREKEQCQTITVIQTKEV